MYNLSPTQTKSHLCSRTQPHDTRLRDTKIITIPKIRSFFCCHDSPNKFSTLCLADNDNSEDDDNNDDDNNNYNNKEDYDDKDDDDNDEDDDDNDDNYDDNDEVDDDNDDDDDDDEEYQGLLPLEPFHPGSAYHLLTITHTLLH